MSFRVGAVDEHRQRQNDSCGTDDADGIKARQARRRGRALVCNEFTGHWWSNLITEIAIFGDLQEEQSFLSTSRGYFHDTAIASKMFFAVSLLQSSFLLAVSPAHFAR